MNNEETRDWYNEKLFGLRELLVLALEELSRKAFKARNKIKMQARNLMDNLEQRERLNIEFPIEESFDEFLAFQQQKKGYSSIAEAYFDIIITSSKSNEEVNRRCKSSKQLAEGGKA